MPCRNSRRASGSRLATGSSRTSSSGRFATARVRASWARWPPESRPARWRGSRPSCSIRRSARPRSQRGLSQAPRRRWSATDRFAYVGVSWATNPTRPSWAGLVGRAARRAPRPCPRVGASSPTARRSSVVLPAPFGPTSPTTRPAGTASVQSDSAHRRRYRLPRPLGRQHSVVESWSVVLRGRRSQPGYRSCDRTVTCGLASLGTMRVLVVEDHEVLARTLGHRAAPRGHGGRRRARRRRRARPPRDHPVRRRRARS